MSSPTDVAVPRDPSSPEPQATGDEPAKIKQDSTKEPATSLADSATGFQEMSAISQVVMIPVFLKEAALDSPSFRATANHINEQFDAMDRWLDSFLKANVRFTQELDTMQDTCNGITSRFVPDFVTRGIIDHDYTILAMRRYAEGYRHLWANIIQHARNRGIKIQSCISGFQKTHLRSYKEARKNFDVNQARYDAALSKYLGIVKTKEPSAIREEAFQLAELKKSYLKSSFDLCCIIAHVESNADHMFVDTFCDSWLLQSGYCVTDPILRKIAIDMHRLKCYSKTTNKTLRPLETEMMKVRNSLEQQTLQKISPSRDLSFYGKDNSVLHQFIPNESSSLAEKNGWLFVKTVIKPARQVWVRRWAFVKNGMFGWLHLAPSLNFVQETDKIGVLLCNVSPEPNEDRRFCFEIMTKNVTVVLQAENLAELKSWLQVFETSKRHILEADSQRDVSAGVHHIYPIIPEFASTAHTTADNDFTHNRLVPSGERPNDSTSVFPSYGVAETTSKILTNQESTTLQSLMNSCREEIMDSVKNDLSSLGPYGYALAPSVSINAPMPTAMTTESFISNSFLTPSAIPSAITANYWGSTNWALQTDGPATSVGDTWNEERTPIIPQIISHPPKFYSAILRLQDGQMRAIFQGMADPDTNDRVVLSFRALWRPHQTKQDIPCRVFCTPKYAYIYARAFTFVTAKKRPWADFISVEGNSNTSYDILHFLLADRATTFTCRIFIDSGSVIQRACQFLIDNSYAETPADLEEIIQKLQSISEQRAEKLRESIEASSPWEDFVQSDLEEESDGGVKGDDEAGTFAPFTKRLLQRYLLGRMTEGNLGLPNATKSNSSFDLSFTMDKCTGKFDYNIPSKALFHIMFGERSPVFKYSANSLYRRDDVQVTSWAYTSTNRLERDISYFFSSLGAIAGSKGTRERVSNIQRIEKRDDNNLYVVYDRRTPWVLPHGYSFYITSRYVIQQQGKSRSKLSIFCTVEWIKSSAVARGMVDGIIYHHVSNEAKQINGLILECQKKLGRKGMTVTAIRLFGKLGATKKEDDKDGVNRELTGGAIEPQASKINIAKGIELSRGTILVQFCGIILGIVFGFLFAPFAFILRSLSKILITLYREVKFNRVILLVLAISLAFNFFLSSRSVVSFWTEKNAVKLMKNVHVIPSPDSAVIKRTIYLADIDDMIDSGNEISLRPTGLCYQKFKTLCGDDNDSIFGFVPQTNSASLFANTLDEKSILLRERIMNLRLGSGTKRNDLLVQLRVLNYLEKESISTEYRNWLLSEISTCSKVSQELSELQIDSDDGVTASSSTLKRIQNYCHSCADEWNATFNENQTRNK